MTNLRTLRERLGWSSLQMAVFLRLNRSTVWRIETGKIEASGPTLTALELTEDLLDLGAEFDDPLERKETAA